VGFGLHPTEVPIKVSAVASARLKVCPADGGGGTTDPSQGKSFGRLWRGGCRPLTDRPLALPATNGAQHVGFRVLPTAMTTVRVVVLTVRWHCTDRYFVVRANRTRVRVGDPTFDCPPPPPSSASP
jgi:hypothetical protein